LAKCSRRSKCIPRAIAAALRPILCEDRQARQKAALPRGTILLIREPWRVSTFVVPVEMDKMMREGTPEQIARDTGIPQNENV
jgi:hypothetical protein